MHRLSRFFPFFQLSLLVFVGSICFLAPADAGTGTIGYPTDEVVTISSSLVVRGTSTPDTSKGEAFPVQVTINMPNRVSLATNESQWGFAVHLNPGANQLTLVQFQPTLLPGNTGSSWQAFGNTSVCWRNHSPDLIIVKDM